MAKVYKSLPSSVVNPGSKIAILSILVAFCVGGVRDVSPCGVCVTGDQRATPENK